MREAVIVEAVRTPIGKRDGALKEWRPDEMAAEVVRELLRRTGVDSREIEDVVVGCVTQTSEQGMNLARLIALAAGLPVDVPGFTVNRMCGSSLQACNLAAQAIQSGTMDVVVALGVESMTRVPMGSDAAPVSDRILDRYEIVPQGISAELIAERWQLSREELDRFSYESHRKAIEASERGDFRQEMLPLEVNHPDPPGLVAPADEKVLRKDPGIFTVKHSGETRRVDRDEGPRADTSLEKLSQLKPAFKEEGVVTAGNSSQISDGAAGLLIVSGQRARDLGLKPRARFLSMAVAGVDPTLMLTGPIPATRKALQKAGLGLSYLDCIEINEAFASVVLACGRELDLDFEKVNPCGGAIALGHPLGCSGARLMTTLLHTLERMDEELGLATMCIGFGQGIATLIERI